MNKLHSIGQGHQQQRWHDVAYWGVLLLACVVFLIMNMLTTLKEDDLAYSLIEGVWTPIRSIQDYWKSCQVHYIHTNGRLADVVAMLFAGLAGKTVFNVCNTVVFGLMAHLVSLLSTGRRSLLSLTLFLAVVGTCFPIPGETMLWQAGSCNYMWAITLTLALICLLDKRQGKRIPWYESLLWLVAAFVAGGFNEATSFGFLLGFCLYAVVNRHQLNRRFWLLLAGYGLGVAFLVCSPGAWHRAASGGIVVDLGLGELLSSRWYIFHEKFWRFYLPVAAVLVGLFLLLTKRGRTVKHSIWTYVFLCQALVLFALGIIHERAYSPWVTVALVIVAMVASHVLSRWQWLRLMAVVGLLALSVFTFGRGLRWLEIYRTYDNRVVKEILNAPRQTVLQAREFAGYSRFVKPMNYKSDHFFAHELIYCAYYDKENVQFVSDSVYGRYHSGRLLADAYRLPLTTDHPDVVDSVLAVKGQDYMVVVLNMDTLPMTFQTARYYISPSSEGMAAKERARREDYGLKTDFNPNGCFPLRYQSLNLLIMPLIDAQTSRIVFPVSMSDSTEVSLFP